VLHRASDRAAGPSAATELRLGRKIIHSSDFRNAMDAPLQVYLDSSDYSRLSASRLDATMAATKAQLLHLRDAGICEYRYSYVHILEMAPVNVAAIDASERRLGLAQELCGVKCLYPTDELLRRELAIAMKPAHGSGKALARSDDAEWLPGGYGFLFRHASALASDIERLLATTKQRGIRDQKVVASAAKLLLIERLNEYATKLPLTETARHRIGSIPLVQFTAERVFNEMSAVFRDLPGLAEWMVKSVTGVAIIELLRGNAKIPLEHVDRIRELVGAISAGAKDKRPSTQRTAATIATNMNEAAKQIST
jgi:hypothetical protein